MSDKIPSDLDLSHVYNPRFHLIDLISTRRNPFSSTRSPPRPPNSFFLMKNCYMLELRLLGYRLAMPDLCRQAKHIWRDIPQDVKDRYDNLALQAQILHHSMYPNYRFKPKKRTTFKPYVPQGSSNMNAFPATNLTFLNENPSSPSLESSSGSEISSSSPMRRSPQPSNDIFLIQPELEPVIPVIQNHYFEENERINNEIYSLSHEVLRNSEQTLFRELLENGFNVANDILNFNGRN